MTKLPIISGADAVKAFGRAGWAVARRRGSHVVLTKPGKRANLSVPLHENSILERFAGCCVTPA